MSFGSWPGLVGEYAIAVTGVHYSIGGHSHGVERINDDVSCCSFPSVSPWSDQNPTLCSSGYHPCFANRQEAEKTSALNSHGRHSDLDVPGSCNLPPFSCRGPMLFVGVCCSRAEPACHLLFDANRGREKESRQQRLEFISLQTDINASKPSPPTQVIRMCLGKRKHSCGPLSPHFLTATTHGDFHNLFTRGLPGCHASWMLR